MTSPLTVGSRFDRAEILVSSVHEWYSRNVSADLEKQPTHNSCMFNFVQLLRNHPLNSTRHQLVRTHWPPEISFTLTVLQEEGRPDILMTTTQSSLLPSLYLCTLHSLFNNYSPKAQGILSNNPRNEIEGIIQQYSLSLRRIIVLV